MITCPNCGRRMKNNAKSCPRCGQEKYYTTIYQKMNDLLSEASEYKFRKITPDRLKKIYRELNQNLKKLDPKVREYDSYNKKIAEVEAFPVYLKLDNLLKESRDYRSSKITADRLKEIYLELNQNLKELDPAYNKYDYYIKKIAKVKIFPIYQKLDDLISEASDYGSDKITPARLRKIYQELTRNIKKLDPEDDKYDSYCDEIAEVEIFPIYQKLDKLLHEAKEYKYGEITIDRLKEISSKFKKYLKELDPTYIHYNYYSKKIAEIEATPIHKKLDELLHEALWDYKFKRITLERYVEISKELIDIFKDLDPTDREYDSYNKQIAEVIVQSKILPIYKKMDDLLSEARDFKSSKISSNRFKEISKELKQYLKKLDPKDDKYDYYNENIVQVKVFPIYQKLDELLYEAFWDYKFNRITQDRVREIYKELHQYLKKLDPKDRENGSYSKKIAYLKLDNLLSEADYRKNPPEKLREIHQELIQYLKELDPLDSKFDSYHKKIAEIEIFPKYQEMDDLVSNAMWASKYDNLKNSKIKYKKLTQYFKKIKPEYSRYDTYRKKIAEIENRIQEREANKLALEKEMTDKMEEIFDIGYFADPHLDDDLTKVLKYGGGGWAAKIPCCDGFVFIHVKDAELDLYRTILKTMRPKETLRYRFKDEKVEVDGSHIGFVCRVTFTNKSNAPFGDDWSGYCFSSSSKFRFNTHKDGRYWYAGHMDRDRVFNKFEGQELFDNTLTLAPGQTNERIFWFIPDGVVEEPNFFSDIVWGEYIASFKFPDGLTGHRKPLSGVVKEVGFPFFSLTQPLNDKRARVLIEVQNKVPYQKWGKDRGMYWVLPTGFKLQTHIPNRKKSLEFKLNKLTFIPYTKHQDAPFKKRVWMMATEPGVEFNVPENQEWALSNVSPIGDQHHLIFNNPDPATGGREPDKVPPLVLHEPKESEETRVVKEEDMDDPVLTYALWLLTHSDMGYRKFAAIRLGELGDKRAIDILIQARNIKDRKINMAVHSSFKRLTNMSIASWLKEEEKKKAK